MHFEFLRQLRERQDQTAVIPTIADILLAQFQEEQAVRCSSPPKNDSQTLNLNFSLFLRWRSAYGAFCSQHLDAVSIYKEQLKSDRRFQDFVQQCSNNPFFRKMSIPEYILTVTTRNVVVLSDVVLFLQVKYLQTNVNTHQILQRCTLSVNIVQDWEEMGLMAIVSWNERLLYKYTFARRDHE